MSANNANLDKVKNMSSDESNPGVNSGAPEKGGVEFDSANIKKQDQAKMFTKVEGAEKRAREAAREEAAEKRADERLKNAEAAERRREEKEAKLVAAAKKDAERAQKHKVRRRVLFILVAMVLLYVTAMVISKVYYRNSDEYSNKRYDEAMSEYATYYIEMEDRFNNGENLDSLLEEYDAKVQAERDDEARLVGELSFSEFSLRYANGLRGGARRLHDAKRFAKTQEQEEMAEYVKCLIYSDVVKDKWEEECKGEETEER